jgi:hypothetical protein
MRVQIIRYRPNPKAATHRRDFKSGFEINAEDILSGPTLEELIPDGWEEALFDDHRIIKKDDEIEGIECICEGGEGIENLPGKEYKIEYFDERDPEFIVSGVLTEATSDR